jgi:NADH-quinone oxidoreductase subunit N
MSTLVKVSAFAAFYRLISIGFFGTLPKISDVLTVVTVATLLLGNLTALFQGNFKRMLAYSGISHAGYMMMAVLSIPTSSASVLFYYACAYSIGSLGVFAISIPVFISQNSEQVSAFNGLGKKNPMLAGLLTMGMFSLAGIPPFAGFMAKYYLFSEAFKNGYAYLTILAVITSIIAVYYYFKVILAMYTHDGNDKPVKPSLMYWIVILVCVGLSLILGVFPGLLTHLLN